jgi:beta-glucosidase
MDRVFPAGFHFGAATSSYQIEGAVKEDGRGPSWWDRFSHTSGNIADGSTGDMACDHYHRVDEDIALMRSLNLNAYRFSVAWPRVVPEGTGAVNPRGLDFYDRLVDRLLAAGLAPYATLYHWDLPLPLAERGGWLNRDTARAFADYAGLVARRLGDRVHSYATLNEPRCSAIVGYQEGRHAPGERDRAKALTAAHHLLLAHGLAMPALRAATRTAKLGIVLDVKPYVPADAGEASAQAARHADGVFNRWFTEPLFHGTYPVDVWEGYGPDVPDVRVGDMTQISQPIDTLGINYYTRGVVRSDPTRPFPHAVDMPQPGSRYTAMGWEVAPQGLHDILTRLHADYEPKDLYVAENGAAFDDVPAPGPVVHDPERREYLAAHLEAVGRAVASGVPLSGYMAWSLLDNFEWGWGYTRRFGIVHVDYPTQRRTPKSSALWYRDFIAAQSGSTSAR